MKRILAILILIGCGAAAQQTTNSFDLGSIATPRTINPAGNSNTPSSLAGQQQNPFLGSVPQGKATPGAIDISWQDAIDQGLHFNLGVVEGQTSVQQARALRLRALSQMLPNVSALLRQNLDDLNRIAIGLKIPGIPAATGQFGYQESYLTVSENGLNLNAAYHLRASRRSVEAVSYSLADARDVVVLAVGTAYLQVIASESRLETAQAEMEFARTLEEQTANRVRNGLAPEIDGLRATVQRQTNEQRITVARASLDKDKLTLARLIGLPAGQQFKITTLARYQSWTGPGLEEALKEAGQTRADLKSALATAQAAALDKKAAELQRVPGLSFNGYYGAIGTTLAHSDSTYALTATLSLPLFTGGRIRSDVQESAAQVRRRQSEYSDLVGRMDYEVRNAFTDLAAAESAVHVAESNQKLAQKSLEQARDRFENGVTNNLEVVQAQQELAAANENYVSSLFAHNLAKLVLLRAMGTAQQDAIHRLGGD